MKLLRRKPLVISGVILCLSLFFVASATAEEPDGNDRKGKYSYRGIYKDCNTRGEVDSKKPLLNPDSKTQAQWMRTFRKKDFEQFGCEKEWGALAEEDLKNILAYLWKHALDSPTPAKCK